MTISMSSSFPMSFFPCDGATPSRSPKNPVVFFAEDDPDLRCAVMESLHDAGFDVFAAATGHEMLRLLTAAARSEIPVPHAIVMDIRMPRCSGIDVLGALRLADWKQPVVMITGFGDRETHERAAKYGASVVLDKPFTTHELLTMLDILLERASAANQMEEEDAGPPTVRSPKVPQRVAW